MFSCKSKDDAEDQDTKKDKDKRERYAATHGEEEGHEWINLGLSVRWATMNVGAAAPNERGKYYAWGETEPKSEYTWETYTLCNGTDNTLTKYCLNSSLGFNSYTDTDTILLLADDAAHVAWGGKWRMPTRLEMVELMTKCSWEWTTQNGKEGVKVSGNGQSIFLPATGRKDGTSWNNGTTLVNYWSSTLVESSRHGYGLIISNNEGTVNWMNGIAYQRYYGAPVRAVCSK